MLETNVTYRGYRLQARLDVLARAAPCLDLTDALRSYALARLLYDAAELSAQHLHRTLIALSRFLACATIAAKACWSVAFAHLLLHAQCCIKYCVLQVTCFLWHFCVRLRSPAKTTCGALGALRLHSPTKPVIGFIPLRKSQSPDSYLIKSQPLEANNQKKRTEKTAHFVLQ